jgi:hypothetical protein
VTSIATVNHQSTFNNIGTFDNSGGNFDIKSAGAVVNSGYFDNNNGVVANLGSFDNTGLVDNTNGSFTNVCSSGSLGEFSGSGTVLGNPVVPSCKVWDNDSGNSLWSEATNWSDDLLPVSDDDVLILAIGGADTTVYMDTSFVIGSDLSARNTYASPVSIELVIQSGVTVTNSGNVSLRGNVKLDNQGSIVNNGFVTTGGGTTIDNKASIVNSGMIKMFGCQEEFVNSGSFSGALVLQSCTRVWDGDGGDGNWSNRLNWSGDKVPLHGNSVDIMSGVVFVDADMTMAGKITVGGGATLWVNGGVTLTLDANYLPISSFPNSITIVSGGTVINDGDIQAVPGGQYGYASCFIDTGGSLVNNNTMSDFVTNFRGLLENHGTMNTVRISSLGGSIKNNGLIDDTKLDLQQSTFTNSVTGTVNLRDS